MTVDLRIDASDFERVGREFTTAARRDLMAEVAPVVAKAALKIKNGMKEDFQGSRYFRRVGQAVTYDIERRAGSVEATIGPETTSRSAGPLTRAASRKGAGNLAHIAYFGGAHGGGGTVRDPQVHLDAETPQLEKYLSQAVDRWLQ